MRKRVNKMGSLKAYLCQDRRWASFVERRAGKDKHETSQEKQEQKKKIQRIVRRKKAFNFGVGKRF